MFVSIRWLARHVRLDGITPEQICNDLTLSTAEVEGLERFAPQLHDVVVGLVIKKSAHPDAEKLSVCLVEVGSGDGGDGDGPLTIVCGAPNVAAGQKVAVACVGTTLPFDFKIKKSKIRGVESRGMICSIRELDLGEEHDGIWVLPEDAPVGAPVAEALGIDDWIIEIDNKSLTHRPDLWGHRGIARELAAIYERELLPLDTTLPETGSAPGYPVTIESKACTRYIALPIDGVSKCASPDWLRWLLLAVGQRAIDLLVDLSNFVMLDLGQPNHVFDRRRLGRGGIVVRDARLGETIVTLDGEERSLDPADLLICAGEEPIALAGIMGGEPSKVADDTDSLLLEVAHFDAVTIRRTSSRVGLRSDASARFEKTLDPTLPLAAAGHFARLLSTIADRAAFPAPITDEGSWHDPSSTIELRCERVRTALGKALSNDEIRHILERLEFSVEEPGSPDEGRFRVSVPSFRAGKDITIEQDLVEEVGRIYRYGNIPERSMVSDVVPPPRDERRRLVRHLQDRLAGGARFHENLSYSFIGDDLLTKLGEIDRPYVSVINPVVQSEAKIRRNVAPSLLSTLEANRRHRGDVRLFEIGKGYEPEHANAQGEPRERHYLALAWAGPRPGKKSRYDENRMMRLHAIVEDLLRSRGCATPSWSSDGERPAWAHPGKCLFLESDASQKGAGPLAVVAELEPGLAPAIGLSGDLESEIAIAEVCLDAMLDAKPSAQGYTPLPRFPGIKVDVAVAVAETTPAAELLALIEKAGKKQVAEIELFDLYRGQSVGEGRKSLAFHVLLQSDKKTLTDKDEQKFLKRFEQLVSEAGFELRGT